MKSKKVFTKVAEALLASCIISVTLCFIAVIIAYPVKWLWNYVIPTIFGLPQITFWQALCLMLLAGFLIPRGGK